MVREKERDDVGERERWGGRRRGMVREKERDGKGGVDGR